LPELNTLGFSWLSLQAPIERTIPEYFINELYKAEIEPILHFSMKCTENIDLKSFDLIFNSYARWGVRYVVLFDNPNSRTAWTNTTWTQSDLVERFLDIYLPIANLSVKAGLTPVFPPLEPGGDYWDLAFFRSAIRGILRRGNQKLLDRLVVGVNASLNNRSLDWGFGGPERWPGARPYYSPPGVQDHMGFRIFEWYTAVSYQELQKRLPMILFRVGNLPINYKKPVSENFNEAEHAKETITITKLLSGDEGIDSSKKIPSDVIACNFWLLTSTEESIYHQQAWFKPDGSTLQVVDGIRRMGALKKGVKISTTPKYLETNININDKSNEEQNQDQISAHSISHYLLLPLYAWGVAEWDLEFVRPFIYKHHPTVGFSLSEARPASRVTIVGGEHAITDEAINMLHSAGCAVERLTEDGIVIALNKI